MPRIQFRSAPAEKLAPTPVSTTTRTAGSLPASCKRGGQVGDQLVVEGVMHLRTVEAQFADTGVVGDLYGAGHGAVLGAKRRHLNHCSLKMTVWLYYMRKEVTMRTILI